ncbi:MAG: MBL fold metallo-hydrolase [Alphaproteobacteria bacterium]|nr:MBL fold metallo-hydrolase [Alphaproteobacteria bacterium]
MRVKILGCGASGGVPLITGEWGVCDPKNPKNRRRRASILVEDHDTTLLVDSSPDLREQCLSNGIRKIDAVIYTHDHADHTQGLDDLRPFLQTQKKPIPLYGDAGTLEDLKSRFGYAFPLVENPPEIYRHFVTPHIIDGPFVVKGIAVTPFLQGHGYSTSLGFRFGKVAYSTDVLTLDEASFQVLEGVDVWIVDCIAMDPRATHSHLPQTLEWIERVKPRQAYLTHMSHHLDYDTLVGLLPKGIEPAYDGLVIEV